MSLHCPQCSHDNSDDSDFCLRCGNRLGQSAPSSSFSPPGNVSTGNLYPQSGASGFGSQSGPYGASGFGAQAGAYGAYGSASAPGSRELTTSPSPMQMGTAIPSSGQVSIRRAFAGQGTLVMHHSWLLAGDGARAGAVLSATIELLRQRFITNLQTSVEHLKERGVNIQGVTPMEEREYLKVRRGVTTVFIYIAPAGQDLYISRATNVLPAISSVRVIVLALWVLAGLFGPSIAGGIFFGPFMYGASLFLSPLAVLYFWIPFVVLVIRSVIHWVFERDFFVYLRSRDLNDFQLDDVMLLERATDDTVHDAVKQCGLDASKVTSPPQGYQPKRRVRAI